MYSVFRNCPRCCANAEESSFFFLFFFPFPFSFSASDFTSHSLGTYRLGCTTGKASIDKGPEREPTTISLITPATATSQNSTFSLPFQPFFLFAFLLLQAAVLDLDLPINLFFLNTHLKSYPGPGNPLWPLHSSIPSTSYILLQVGWTTDGPGTSRNLISTAE